MRRIRHLVALGILLLHAGSASAADPARPPAGQEPASRLPDAVASSSALSVSRLRAGERAKALDAAREGIAATARWKTALGALPPWDGTSRGTGPAIDSLTALFPRGKETPLFESAVRRILSVSSLLSGLLAAEERSLELQRMANRLSGVSRERIALWNGQRTRVERLGERFRGEARRAEDIRRRILLAADEMAVTEWGKRTDPKTAALLEEATGKLSEAAASVTALQSAAREMAERQRTRDLPPDDRRMFLFARDRLARAIETAAALDARLALLRAEAWDRWKESYVLRLNRLLDGVDNAARQAEAGVAAAGNTAGRLRDAAATIEGWEEPLLRMGERTAAIAAALRSRRAELRVPADEAFASARRAALAGIARKERSLHHLAGRAAAEWLLEGAAARTGDASPPSPGLLTEAIRHLEASLPPSGEAAPYTDESLFALGALRFEEAEQRRYGGKEGERRNPDFSVPAAYFQRLVAGFPESPYSEPARYGHALCLQEAGAEDNAVRVLEGLLARYPATRYADEANLRIGEYRFDRSDYPGAEAAYRGVRDTAPAELLTTARFKLGWSRFLQGRPGDSVPTFLEAALLSSGATRTGGLREEALKMTARSLVDAGMDREAEEIVARRGAKSLGPALLLEVQNLLDAQNRYEEAAATATRLGAAYPAAAERLDSEEAAAAALRKQKKDDESMLRRASFSAQFGPGSAWRSAPGRSAAEIARADGMTMEGLAAAGFHFHAISRERPPGDRPRVLAIYDTYLARFPSSDKAGEVTYQRAWLLYEANRKPEALSAFQSAARHPAGTRVEASRYMAVQCAKDLSSPGNAALDSEIVRLAREYEAALPKGDRLFLVRLDRAGAHFRRKEWAEAADAATQAGGIASGAPDRRAAYRIAGESHFEGGRYPEAEKAFRKVLQEDPPPAERAEIEKWVGFSIFRTAETLPPGRGAEAGALFLRIPAEFPRLPIVPEARFRAGDAYAGIGKDNEAIGAFLPVESDPASSPLAVEAARRLAVLFERSGNPLPAAERHVRLSGLEREDEGRGRYLHHAAELFSRGKDEARSRKAYADVSGLAGVPAEIRVESLFRAGESARTEGKPQEADDYYSHAVRIHRETGGAAAAIAGRALFQLAEFRYAAYLALRIAPPLEATFARKQEALTRCVDLYAEAVRVGGDRTASASLHRIGEGLEDFRAAILASPPPSGLTSVEKEEYMFLLEERAAPIEGRAVESYRSNLLRAAAGDHFDPSVGKSRERLRALRPAVFGRSAEFAFPVMSVPDFLGITERATP